MRELDYIILELEEWCSNSNLTCDFCSSLFGNDNKAVCQIRTRSKVVWELIANDFACESCKEKLENGELSKCERCGRLQTNSRFSHGKFICRCVEYNENIEEKELPALPHQRESTFAFYERQINGLQEQLAAAEEAVEIEREEVAKFQEKSEEWSERQKRELLDKVKDLEAEVAGLKRENGEATVSLLAGNNLNVQQDDENHQRDDLEYLASCDRKLAHRCREID